MKMMERIARVRDYGYAPAPGRSYGAENPFYTISQQRMARFIGIIAIAMPWALYLVGRAWREIGVRDSISDFYYAPFFGDALVGALCIIGAIMLAYQAENIWENIIATTIGILVIAVALLPVSEEPGALSEVTSRAFVGSLVSGPYQLFSSVSTWHYVAAAGLFGCLIWYAEVVFRRPLPVTDGYTPTPEDLETKKTRDRIYRASAIVMAASVALLAANFIFRFNAWDDWDLTLWVELIALNAFGVSWLIKGRAIAALMDSRDMAARAAVHEAHERK